LVRGQIAGIYLVTSLVIESGRKPPSTRAEIVVVLESKNSLRNILIIHERSKIFFLKSIKFASAAVYRAGQVLERLDEAFI